jgi:NADH:ubiquinone oxidoreductase subunit 5 (subunit L)/multisubunit Na+/H+ antiporter MnhA subunit
VIVLGSLTAFFAATIGVFQNDIKKIIAYSTCSQLGYMFICCGLSLYNISLFHLFNHGFFKALLFLSAGSIIHSLSGEQDIRRMGGLARMLPFSYMMILLGSLALSGFPFFSGFYSKDLILETAGLCFDSNFVFAFILGCLAAFFTAFYSFRLIFFVFFDEIKLSKFAAFRLSESSFKITFALGVLAFFAIFCGFLFYDLFAGLGNTVFYSQASLYTRFEKIFFVENELLLGILLKLVPLAFSFLGAYGAIYLNLYHSESLVKFKRKHYFAFCFLSKKWYFDYIYNYIIIRNFLIFGYEYFFRTLERGLFVNFGPVGLNQFLEKKKDPFILQFHSVKNADYL